jgi:DNA-binding GntR family transcriptional regulator
MTDIRDAAHLLVDTAEPRTAHQFALDTLKRAILSGALPGGTRLIQADLANQLNISTTPVREALRDLVAVGLIRFDAHRGAVVKEMDVSELLEIYELRRLLEPFSIRKVAEKITTEEIEAAEVVQQSMEKAEDPSSWVELNWEFHSLLESAAHTHRLQEMVKATQNLAAIYVAHSLNLNPERMAEGNRQHRALLAALRHHNADKAAKVLTEHLDGTLAAILATEKDMSSGNG